MLALDPPDGGATVGGIVASARLRPAALALRRRARPRGGHARGALRRHPRQDRRQGDQERGRLRPGQALRRLVRHARRDPRGGRAPAPASAVHRHGDRAHRGRRRCWPRRRPRSPTRRSSTAGSTCAGRTAPAPCSPASAAPRPRPRPRTRPGCFAKPGSTPTWSRRTTSSGAHSATTSARGRASPTRWCAWRALQTDLPELLDAATRHSALLVGRAPLGLSWLRLADPEAVPGRAPDLRRIAGAVVLDAPAEVRERVEPWGERDAAVLALMRRVKDGFDPAGVCAPGVLA